MHCKLAKLNKLTIYLLIFVLSIFYCTYIQGCSVRKYQSIWLLKQKTYKI